MSSVSLSAVPAGSSSILLDFSVRPRSSSPLASALDVSQVRDEFHRLSGMAVDRDIQLVTLQLNGRDLRHSRASSWLASFLFALLWRQQRHHRLRQCSTGGGVPAEDSSLLSYPSPVRQMVLASRDEAASTGDGCVVVVDLDLSTTGAFDAVDEWVRYFDKNRELSIPTPSPSTLSSEATMRRQQQPSVSPQCHVSAEPTLCRLTADDEVLSPLAASPLLSSIFFGNLTHVRLRRCLIGSTACAAIADGLQRCSAASIGRLSLLDLSENEIASEGLRVIADALHKSAHISNSLSCLFLNCNRVGAADASCDTYCRAGLLSLAQFVLRASRLTELRLDDNALGKAYRQWPAGGDHGGVSEVCEAARRALACKTVEDRRPAVIDLRNNQFSDKSKESLGRCSGFTAQL